MSRKTEKQEPKRATDEAAQVALMSPERTLQVADLPLAETDGDDSSADELRDLRNGLAICKDVLAQTQRERDEARAKVADLNRQLQEANDRAETAEKHADHLRPYKDNWDNFTQHEALLALEAAALTGLCSNPVVWNQYEHNPDKIAELALMLARAAQKARGAQ